MTQDENKKALSALREKLPSYKIEPFDGLTPGGMIEVESIDLEEFATVFATIKEAGYPDIRVYPDSKNVDTISIADLFISIQFTTASGWFKD